MSEKRPKARTVAGKRRAGRPRENAAERYQSGQSKGRIMYSQRIDLKNTGTAYRRCAVMGLDDTPENRERVMCQEGGYFLGQLTLITLDGMSEPMLPKPAYRGLFEFGRLYARYLRALGAPKPMPKIGSYSEMIAGGDEPYAGDDANYLRRVIDAYTRAEKILDAASARESVMLAFYAPEGARPRLIKPTHLRALRRAGRAFAIHFGIDSE